MLNLTNPKLPSGWCAECGAFKPNIYGLCSCGKFTEGYVYMFVCSCGEKVSLSEAHVDWFNKRNLSLPAHCETYRLAKSKKKLEEKRITEERAKAKTRLEDITKRLATKRAEIAELNQKLHKLHGGNNVHNQSRKSGS